jgi:hypothetical protein
MTMYIRQIKFILFETMNFLIALYKVLPYYFNKLFGDSFCGVGDKISSPNLFQGNLFSFL